MTKAPNPLEGGLEGTYAEGYYTDLLAAGPNLSSYVPGDLPTVPESTYIPGPLWNPLPSTAPGYPAPGYTPQVTMPQTPPVVNVTTEADKRDDQYYRLEALRLAQVVNSGFSFSSISERRRSDLGVATWFFDYIKTGKTT